jgi:hypothetical protein
MRVLPALLLLLIASVQYVPDLLEFSYPNPDAARKVLYYIARSFEGAIQYAVIALMVWWGRPKEASRSKDAAPITTALLVVVVCAWGAIEHLQAGVCRLSIGIANKTPAGSALTGLCDHLTALPMYALGLGMVAFLAAVIAAQSLGGT